MKKICVFCGSKSGTDSKYINEAKKLGSIFAREQIHLVYGGARIGLMGAIADAVIEGSGSVTGVITDLLNPIEGHTGLDDLRIVPNMHDRKFTMYSISDAFIIMPGGFGTMDEFFETLTWSQLNIHKKPIGILNVDGYYKTLNELFENMIAEGFVAKEYRDLYFIENDSETLIKKMKEKF
jgi:uncharacterized protein (TIGR00730 family)